MRVYLDNNVFVDIEEGLFKIEDFMLNPRLEYYYSDTHMSELLNGLDKSIPGLKDRRLTTIETICGKRFLAQDDSFQKVCLAECDPKQAFENSERFGFMRVFINQLAQRSTPNRQGILKELNWDAREIGSYEPYDIIGKIEDKLLESKYHFGIKDFLFLSEASTGRTIFSCLFNLLDMVGYRKDKNNVARLYDSSHAFYAQKCNIFVSNDSRMRLKTEAVYHYLHIKTRVMDTRSFLALVE